MIYKKKKILATSSLLWDWKIGFAPKDVVPGLSSATGQDKGTLHTRADIYSHNYVGWIWPKTARENEFPAGV